MTVYHYQIREAEQALEGFRDAYLRRWGWVHTCSTPGSYWVWRRDFKKEDAAALRRWKRRKPGPLGKPSKPVPYGVITAPAELAVLMTVRCLDEQPEINHED